MESLESLAREMIRSDSQFKVNLRWNGFTYSFAFTGHVAKSMEQAYVNKMILKLH